jgi:arsenate reductase
MTAKIYHNPRCRKSREGLQLLEEKGIDVEIIKYLDHVPSIEELKDLVQKLNVEPIDIIRKNEKVWKEMFKGKTLSDEDLFEAMHNHPKLIERPIVVVNQNAVIGRPKDQILSLIK